MKYFLSHCITAYYYRSGVFIYRLFSWQQPFVWFPDSGPSWPKHRTVWTGQPLESCHHQLSALRRSAPRGKWEQVWILYSSVQLIYLHRPIPSRLRSYLARGVGRGHGAPETLGAVDHDDTGVSRLPQLLQQVRTVIWGISAAVGFQNHALHGRLQKGPHLDTGDSARLKTPAIYCRLNWLLNRGRPNWGISIPCYFCCGSFHADTCGHSHH